MVEESKNAAANSDNIINQNWAEKLIEEDVFEGDPSTWKVTSSNFKIVLAALGMKVEQFQQAVVRAIDSNNDQLPYSEFCQLYHKELLKAAAFELRAMDDTDLLETPAQKIISLLREIQNKYVATNQEPQLIERINYAIDKIGQRTIFDIDYPLLDSLDLALQRRPSLTKGWLNEYSNRGLEILRETSLNAHIKQQKQRRKQNADTVSQSQISRAPSLNTIQEYIDEHRQVLECADTIEFDTLDFCKRLGRKAALSTITIYISERLKIDMLPQLN